MFLFFHFFYSPTQTHIHTIFSSIPYQVYLLTPRNHHPLYTQQTLINRLHTCAQLYKQYIHKLHERKKPNKNFKVDLTEIGEIYHLCWISPILRKQKKPLKRLNSALIIIYCENLTKYIGTSTASIYIHSLYRCISVQSDADQKSIIMFLPSFSPFSSFTSLFIRYNLNLQFSFLWCINCTKRCFLFH